MKTSRVPESPCPYCNEPGPDGLGCIRPKNHKGKHRVVKTIEWLSDSHYTPGHLHIAWLARNQLPHRPASDHQSV
jgi:hypothetical protein